MATAPFARLAARIAQQKNPPSSTNNKTAPGGTPGRQPSPGGFAGQQFGSRPIAPRGGYGGIAPPGSWRPRQPSSRGFGR